MDHTKQSSSLLLRAPVEEVEVDTEVDEDSRLVFVSKNEYFHINCWDDGRATVG